MKYKDIAEKLWQLLDDIDTIDDIVKSNEKAYRDNIRKKVAERFKYLSSDGYNLRKLKKKEIPSVRIIKEGDVSKGWKAE